MYNQTTSLRLQPCTQLFVLLLLFICSQMSFADDKHESSIKKVHIKSINVASNGQSYTQTNAGSPISVPISADVEFWADAGNVGRVKSWSVWLNLRSNSAPFSNNFFRREFKEYKFSQSYPLTHRPRTVNRTELLSIPASAYSDLFVSHCNMLGNQLRTQGLSNQQIFAEDRTISYNFNTFDEVNFTWGILGGGFDTGPIWSNSPYNRFDVVCKKWQGSKIPVAGQNTVAIADPVYEVTEAKINTITANSTLGGHCNVNINSTLKSLQPNTPIRFRYKHFDGHTGLPKLSKIYEVTTDDSKRVSFSHQFDVPNNENTDEHGTIEIVGQSPEFNSKRKLYEMSCSEAGPSGVTTDLAPSASMYYIIQERAQVGNQFCPTKVRFIGTVKTKGARKGKANFVGDQYLSSAYNFDLAANSQQNFIAERDIDWSLGTNTPQAASHIAYGNTAGQALRFKDIRVKFNVSTQVTPTNAPEHSINMLVTSPEVDTEYRLAAQSQQHNIHLKCEELQDRQTPTSPFVNNNNLNNKKIIAKPAISAPAVVLSNLKADLLIKAMKIANQEAGSLDAKEAIQNKNGYCLFDLTYSIKNTGKVKTSPFKYQLVNGNKVISQNHNIILKANELDSFHKTVRLSPGINTVILKVDPDNTVDESNEANNKLIKRYNVVGSCNGKTTPILKSANKTIDKAKTDKIFKPAPQRQYPKPNLQKK